MLKAKTYSPVVPEYVLSEVYMWLNSGIPMLDVVDRLSARTVLPGYTPHPWTRGKQPYVSGSDFEIQAKTVKTVQWISLALKKSVFRSGRLRSGRPSQVP